MVVLNPAFRNIHTPRIEPKIRPPKLADLMPIPLTGLEAPITEISLLRPMTSEETNPQNE